MQRASIVGFYIFSHLDKRTWTRRSQASIYLLDINCSFAFPVPKKGKSMCLLLNAHSVFCPIVFVFHNKGVLSNVTDRATQTRHHDETQDHHSPRKAEKQNSRKLACPSTFLSELLLGAWGHCCCCWLVAGCMVIASHLPHWAPHSLSSSDL